MVRVLLTNDSSQNIDSLPNIQSLNNAELTLLMTQLIATDGGIKVNSIEVLGGYITIGTSVYLNVDLFHLNNGTIVFPSS